MSRCFLDHAHNNAINFCMKIQFSSFCTTVHHYIHDPRMSPSTVMQFQIHEYFAEKISISSRCPGTTCLHYAWKREGALGKEKEKETQIDCVWLLGRKIDSAPRRWRPWITTTFFGGKISNRSPRLAVICQAQLYWKEEHNWSTLDEPGRTHTV